MLLVRGQSAALHVVVLLSKKWIYIALFYCCTSHSRRTGADHTVLAANYTNTCLYLVSVQQISPSQTDVADI